MKKIVLVVLIAILGINLNAQEQPNKNKKVDEAISKIQDEIIFKNAAKHIDYGLLGSFYLSYKQFEKAELNLEKAILLDKTDLTHRLNLSYVYLFTDRVSEAKDIHSQYKMQNITSNVSWVNQTKSDFSDFKNHVFFGSAQKKLENFKDKAVKLEGLYFQLSSSLSISTKTGFEFPPKSIISSCKKFSFTKLKTGATELFTAMFLYKQTLLVFLAAAGSLVVIIKSVMPSLSKSLK